jgi:hypothetical protein
MDDNLNGTIEHLKKKIEDLASVIQSDPRMVEIAKLHKALNTIEELCGSSKTSLAHFLVPNDSPVDSTMAIEVDTFFGMKPIIAAKKYLRMKKKAASFNEIVDSLKSGGCPVSDPDKLKISLGRSNTQIAKVDEDHYGLVEFYPDLKRSRRRKGITEEGESMEESSDLEEEDSEPENSVAVNEVNTKGPSTATK